MNRKQADYWCERGILFLTLAILVFGPLATGAVRMLEFLVIQTLTVGVLGLWLARVWLSRRVKLLWPPVCWAVTAFVIFAAARYATADIEYVARQELLRILVYAFLFFAILNNLHGQESMRAIVFTTVFLAMLISCYAIYQFVTDSDRVWHFVSLYRHRASGTYINPNHLAGFLEMILPVGLAWTFASRAKPVMKVLLGYASLVMLAGLAVTLSRGAWLSVAVVLLIMVVGLAIRSVYRWPILIAVALTVAAGAYILPKSFVLKKRLELVTQELTDVNSVGNRPMIWRAALALWNESDTTRWWGVGPGHFDYRFRAYRPPLVQMRPDRVHNDYLNTLVDWGIVGTALVAAVWGLLGLGVAQTWRYVRGSVGDLGGRLSNKYALVFGASLGLLALLLHAGTDFNLHIPANAILAVTWMALLSAHLRFATERYWFTAQTATKLLVTGVLLAGITYLGAQGWRRAHEYAGLNRVENLRTTVRCYYTPEEIATREKVFTVEPMNFENTYELGEAFRTQSWQGGENFGTLATNAMTWYERTMTLNRFDPNAPLRYGMCLDWVGRHEEAQAYFDRAAELDPKGYYTVAHVGWHYVQIENYAAAVPWFELSRRLKWENNAIAETYLEICRTRLLEAATNTSPLRLQLPPR